MGTLYRCDGYYTVQTVYSLPLQYTNPTPKPIPITENLLHFYIKKKTKKHLFFIFIPDLQMRTEIFGDFVRVWSLLGTNMSPKYSLYMKNK